MNWNEVGLFTWGELSSLKWDELKLRADELIEKLHNDKRIMPVPAYEKLLELNSMLPTPPKIKKGLTIAEGCAIVTAFITYVEKFVTIANQKHEMIEKVFDFFHTLFTHLQT